MKKNLILFIGILFSINSFCQDIRSYMQLGFNSDAFIGKNSFMGYGFKVGYQYNCLDEKQFLRFNSSATFGNGKNTVFSGMDLTGSGQIVEKEFDYFAVRFALTGSYQKFIKGDLTTDGFYFSAGAGMLMYDLTLDFSAFGPGVFPTPTVNVAETQTYFMVGVLGGIGYHYNFDAIQFFADMNLYLPIGRAANELNYAKTPLGNIFPSVTVGIVFQLKLLGTNIWF